MIALRRTIDRRTGFKVGTSLPNKALFFAIDFLQGWLPSRLSMFKLIPYRTQRCDSIVITFLLYDLGIVSCMLCLLENSHLFYRWRWWIWKITSLLWVRYRFTIWLHIKGGRFWVLPRSVCQRCYTLCSCINLLLHSSTTHGEGGKLCISVFPLIV